MVLPCEFGPPCNASVPLVRYQFSCLFETLLSFFTPLEETLSGFLGPPEFAEYFCLVMVFVGDADVGVGQQYGSFHCGRLWACPCPVFERSVEGRLLWLYPPVVLAVFSLHFEGAC